MSEELVDKWRVTGLLDELDDKGKDELSEHLESAAHILMNVKEHNDDELWCSLCLPIITRIYRENNKVKIKLNVLRQLMNELKDVFNPDEHIDWEAELCSNTADIYLGKKYGETNEVN